MSTTTIQINKRNATLDVMKIICAILVVLGHVMSVYTPYAAIEMPEKSSIIIKLWRFIYSFHMPAFIAISGAIYSINKCKRQTNFLLFIQKKWKRLFIPYLVFLFLYTLPIMSFIQNGINFHQFFYEYILAANPRHLWYLFTLFFIFIIYDYFYKEITNNLINSFFIFLLIYLSTRYLPSTFQLYNITKFLIYFHLGCFLPSAKKILERDINILTLPLFLIIYILTFKMYNPLACLIIASGGILTIYCLSHFISKYLNNDTISYYAKNTYGIYLFHTMINYLIFHYIFKMHLNPIFMTLVITIICWFLSSYLTDIARKIHLSWIIGE